MTQFFVDNLIPLLSAAVFLAAAIVLARKLLRSSELRRNGTRAPGTIVGVTWERRSEGQPTSNVAFRFETANGRTVVEQVSYGGGEHGLHEGRPITVAYDPASPDKAEIMDTESHLRGGVQMVAVLVAGSVICVFLGVMS